MRKKYGVTDNDNRKVLKITICVTVENETESAEQIILTRRACVCVCARICVDNTYVSTWICVRIYSTHFSYVSFVFLSVFHIH